MYIMEFIMTVIIAICLFLFYYVCEMPRAGSGVCRCPGEGQ